MRKPGPERLGISGRINRNAERFPRVITSANGLALAYANECLTHYEE